jgi:hypothetical protein
MSVVVCRRDAFERFGRFDESLHIVHDLDWYGRVVAGGGRVIRVPRRLVARSVPGGLVESYRRWFEEERAVHARTFAADPAAAGYARMVRAYRSLFFARIAVDAGDVGFGVSRLAGAFRASPAWTLRIAALRVWRRWHVDRRVVARTPREPACGGR